jgi:transcriptional regulator with XRE-family HTH domain
VAQEKFKQVVMTQRIRQLYKESGRIQEDFAAKVGLSQPSIYGYLEGSRPSLGPVVKIAVGCGVSVDWLVGLD